MDSLHVELPDDFDKYEETVKELVIQYLSQLNPIEKKAYMIGKSHLGSSFSVLKSNGFNDWKKTKQQT